MTVYEYTLLCNVPHRQLKSGLEQPIIWCDDPRADLEAIQPLIHYATNTPNLNTAKFIKIMTKTNPLLQTIAIVSAFNQTVQAHTNHHTIGEFFMSGLGFYFPQTLKHEGFHMLNKQLAPAVLFKAIVAENKKAIRYLLSSHQARFNIKQALFPNESAFETSYPVSSAASIFEQEGDYQRIYHYVKAVFSPLWLNR